MNARFAYRRCTAVTSALMTSTARDFSPVWRIRAEKSRRLRPADRIRAIARPEACRSRSADLRPRFPSCKLQARDCCAPICTPQTSRFPFPDLQAGLGWPGLAWAGLGWPGLAWAGLGWCGLAWAGLGWPGLAWAGLGWPGLAWVIILLTCVSCRTRCVQTVN